MAKPIRTVTKVIARSGHEDALKALLIEVVELARENPGCLRFELLQGNANPGEFVTVGDWHDDAAFQAHYRSGYMDEFMREIPDLADHSPDIQWYTLVL